MTRFLLFLRSLIWTSVLSVAAIVAAVISALVSPQNLGLPLVLSISAVAFALLPKD